MTNTMRPHKIRATVTAAAPIVARKAKAPKTAPGAPAGPTSKVLTKAAPKSATGSASAVVTSSARPKPKLVRDSFTIPKSEYAVLEGLKDRAVKLTRPAKKSELLRAGIAALNAMNDKAFLAALNVVPSLKTGRPNGSEATSDAGKASK